MKRIFKVLSLFLSAVLLMSVVASCGKDSDDSSKKSSQKDSSSMIEVIGEDDLDDSSSDKNSSGSKNNKDKNNNESNQSGNKDKTDSKSSGQNGDNLKDSEEKTDANNSGSSDKSNGNNTSDNKTSGGNTTDNKSNTNKTTNKNNNNSESKANSDNTTGGKTDVKLNGKEKTFVITLYPEYAPITCKHFEKLVNNGFYNGLTFDRVIDNFVAQAGKSDKSDRIKGEFKSNGVNNGLSHLRGTVSMARLAEDPNSASGQFFICYDDNCKFLDGQYAAFGRVTEGIDVVDGFMTIERTNASDGTLSKPVSSIKIKLAKIDGKDSDGNTRVKFYVEY